jgi:DNA-binding MarR family transcriptional regulator
MPEVARCSIEQCRFGLSSRVPDRFFPVAAGQGIACSGTTDEEVTMPEARKTPGIAKAKSERAREVSEIFARNYMDYQYRFVEFFVEHLEDVSRAFRGDLQQMMVLAIIGQVKLRVVRDAILAGEDPATLPPERCGIGASRIADVTAIPRQTVRRKLELLEQRGWIERLDDSTWTLRYQDGVAQRRMSA